MPRPHQRAFAAGGLPMHAYSGQSGQNTQQQNHRRFAQEAHPVVSRDHSNVGESRKGSVANPCPDKPPPRNRPQNARWRPRVPRRLFSRPLQGGRLLRQPARCGRRFHGFAGSLHPRPGSQLSSIKRTLQNENSLLAPALLLAAGTVLATAQTSSRLTIKNPLPLRNQKLRPLRHRQDRRPLHRLLPVRLRQLGQEQSHSRPTRCAGRGLLACSASATATCSGRSSTPRPKDPKTPLQKKYGDFYAACMNTDLVEKKGIEPIKPALDRIASLNDAQAARRPARRA